MSNFEQDESARSAECRESDAPNLADTLHMLDRARPNGVFKSQAEIPFGVNSNDELLAQLAGTSTLHEEQRRSRSGLPVTDGGQPALPRTYEEMDASMDAALRYWADLIPPS